MQVRRFFLPVDPATADSYGNRFIFATRSALYHPIAALTLVALTNDCAQDLRAERPLEQERRLKFAILSATCGHGYRSPKYFASAVARRLVVGQAALTSDARCGDSADHTSQHG
jgi:hypothetical protein